ncbi:nuclease-related domain-containing protein [Streptomyces sp. AD55]|uniref:nuclease-related domain-containing protein n=1 Tax=Streptomyces sp. AD55 TaxID=3242895 RepID=UPI0035274646
MSAAGRSVSRWGQQQRAAARKGLWRALTARLGLNPAARRADARAAACTAGAVGEQRTAALLSVLEPEGWLVLHDRAIPGARTANADHVLVSPGARVFMVDSKLWSGKWRVRTAGGSLLHGQADRNQSLRSALYETELISRVLGVSVQPVIAVHNAPVDEGGFIVSGVPVVPADRLVEVLRGNDGPVSMEAAWLGARTAWRLPEYLGGG